MGGLIVLFVVALIAAALYLQRGAVGAQFARSYLRGRGVPSVIVVERLDRKGFTGRIVLGDPADPDLSVRRVEVEFEPVPLIKGGGLLAPRIRSMRLVEPRLKARWDGRRLTFGTLQRLVDDLSAAPGTGPGPTVIVERGAARLATPAGELRLNGDGRLDRGRLTRLAARLQPVALRRGALSAQVTDATLQATTRGARIVAALHLDVPLAAQEGTRVEGLQADFTGELPYNQTLRLDGLFRLDGTLRASAATSGGQRLADPRAALALAGMSSGPIDRLGLKGSGTGSLSASAWSAPGASIQRLDLAGRLVGLDLIRSAGVTRFSLDADLGGVAGRTAAAGVRTGSARLNARLAEIRGTVDRTGGRITLAPDLTLSTQRAEIAGLVARDGAVDLTSPGAALSWRSKSWSLSGPPQSRALALESGTWSLTGPLQARVRAGTLVQPVLAGDLSLRAFALNLSGRTTLGSVTPRLDLEGSATSQGGSLSPAAARAFAASLPVIGTDPLGQAAILGAFRTARLDAPAFALRSDASGVRVSLPQPLRLLGTDGARASVSALAGAPLAISSGSGVRGGLVAQVSGAGLPEFKLDVLAYRAGQDRGGLTLQAETRLSAAFSGAGLRDLKLEAPARLSRTGGVLAAALSDCASVTLAGFGLAAEPLLTGVQARACGDAGAPVLTLGPASWRFRARLEDFQADAPAGEVRIRAGRGPVELSGTGRGAPVGSAEIVSARVTDAAAMKRFEPLALSGRAELAQDIWSGPIQVAEAAKGRPVATVRFTHGMANGTGGADIAAPALTFAEDGLQPGDLSPVAGGLASDAKGVASFTGRADWSPGGGVVSRGRLTTAGIDFRSRFGLVKQATADLTFTSLAPLETAPGQPAGAEAVGWLVPLEHATARIVLKADRLGIESASAEVANGKISVGPVDLLYAPNSPMSGVVTLDEIDLGALIERFNLADKISLQARIDGVVPFSLAGGSLRLDKGHVFATGPGRLSIKREALTGATASAPGAPAPAGGVQDMAYQALENLAFDKLEADIASQPMGRLGILFRINGRNDPPGRGETRISLFDLLRGRAFDRPIALPKGTPVNLTLDTSLNFDELLAAYGGHARSEPVQPGPAKE